MLSQFRPPQFSEDAAWLPIWLQQCDPEESNVDEYIITKDCPTTFEQRIEEELRFFRKGVANEESSREYGGCNVGQLFLSGTENSPFSLAKSADNVVHIRLFLSPDGNSGNTNLTPDSRQTESSCPLVMHPLESSAILVKNGVNSSMFYSHGGVNLLPTVELENTVDKNALFKHKENEKFSEVADDAAELCIAASEALVINDVTENDSFAKPSASATLEASLQLKQARLEVWRNTIGDIDDESSESDDLSDLDDTTMESAYEDAGILFNELSSCELSVSRVKDTLDSEYVENLKHVSKTSAFASSCGKSCDDNSVDRMEIYMDNDKELENDLMAVCIDGDVKHKVTGNPELGLGTDVGYDNDSSRPVEAPERFDLSVSEKNEKSISHEPNVSSSRHLRCQVPEKEESLSKIFKERFQSRWFGGWTGNNEVKHLTTVRAPFVAETSFLSESADTPVDENSFVQNHDKGATIASQLSIRSENFSNRAKDTTMLSQDVVRSSSTSYVDPLCSFVPCSISDDICSSPAIKHDCKLLPTKSNVPCSSPSEKELAQGGRNDMQIGNNNTKDSRDEVCRKFTSLSSYSNLPSSANVFVKDSCHQKRSFLVNSNPELTVQDTPSANYEETVKDLAELPFMQKDYSRPSVVNCRTPRHFRGSNCSAHNPAIVNPHQTEFGETTLKCLPSENLQWGLLKCKNQSDQQLPHPKRVHFSERPQNEQTASKICGSFRAAKKPTRSTRHLESKAQQMNALLKNPLNKEKKRLIFQNMEFLLTGFSRPKEEEIEGLIRKYGGIVLSQIPSTNLKGKRSSWFKSQVLPVVLCLKKTQSFKFLYGCALNAFVLKANWLVDSIAAGFVMPPKRYMILSRNIGTRHAQVYAALNYDKHSLVFNNTGIMLHGKSKFFTNIATIIQHGGGQVFKTLQRLVQTLEAGKISMGVVVADDASCASRHLKHCAVEHSVPMTSVSWIIKSLYAGQLLPMEENNNFHSLPAIMRQRCQDSMELSQEI